MSRERFQRTVLGLLVITLVALLAAPVVQDRWRLGIDPQERVCLPPWRVFLIDTHHRPERGGLLAFRADHRQAPYFRAGQWMVKVVAGQPGDRVRVAGDGVWVNQQRVIEPAPFYGSVPLAATLRQPEERFYREETVPADHWFVLGRTADSYDSRYWGLVEQSAVQGLARPLWPRW